MASPTDAMPIVHRIAARILPAGITANVHELPLEGMQVTLHASAAGESQAHCRNLQRELTRVGWHVHPLTAQDTPSLLILGWSVRGLRRRAEVLQQSLAGALADYGHTVTVAVHLAERAVTLDRRPGDWRTDDIGRVVSATEQAMTTGYLYWPVRLAEIDGLQRTSGVRAVQQLLSRVTGLETAVMRRCLTHQILTQRTAEMFCRHLAVLKDLDAARHLTLATLRFGAATMPNASLSAPPTAWSGMERLVASTVRNTPPAQESPVALPGEFRD